MKGTNDLKLDSVKSSLSESLKTQICAAMATSEYDNDVVSMQWHFSAHKSRMLRGAYQEPAFIWLVVQTEDEQNLDLQDEIRMMSKKFGAGSYLITRPAGDNTTVVSLYEGELVDKVIEYTNEVSVSVEDIDLEKLMSTKPWKCLTHKDGNQGDFKLEGIRNSWLVGVLTAVKVSIAIRNEITLKEKGRHEKWDDPRI